MLTHPFTHLLRVASHASSSPQASRIVALEAGLRDQTDRADQAMSVAIAGLVLGVVLGLLGVLLGGIALSKSGTGGADSYTSNPKQVGNPTFGVTV